MKVFLYLLIAAIGVVGACSKAQSLNPTDDGELYAFCSASAQCGFLSYSGEVAIPPTYEKVVPFDENGMAAAVMNGKAGFIDKAGEIVVPTVFSLVENFEANGLARVMMGDKIGLIDRKGETIVPPQYDEITPFNETNVAVVESNEKYGLIDAQGEIVMPLEYDYISRINLGFNYTKRQSTLTGSTIFRVNLGDKLGIIDHNGRVVLPIQYDQMEFWADTVNGKLLIRVGEDKKFGYSDTEGNLVIPVRYDYADIREDNGLIGVVVDGVRGYSGGKLGFVNEAGELKIPTIYEPIGRFIRFSSGFAAVGLDGKIGFIDTKGALVVPTIYDEEISGFNALGQAEVKRGDEYITVDRTGEVIRSNKLGDDWEELDIWTPSHLLFGENGLLKFKQREKWGLLNKAEEVVVPAIYDDISAYDNNGLYKVELDGKFGYIDSRGKMIAPPIFDDVWIWDSQVGVFAESEYEFLDWSSDGTYIAASFRDQIYPITMEGEFIGFSASDVMAANPVKSK